MKRSFEKSSAERKERIEKEITNESKTPESVKENLRNSSRLDNQKEDRAKRNLFESGILNK